MENIVKQTLEKTLNELYDQIETKQQGHDQLLSNGVHEIVDSIDDLFKEFIIKVSETEISFKHKENHSWYDFRINRTTNYGSEEKTFKEAKLSYSSYSELDKTGLEMTVCIGSLARHCLYNTNEWRDLVGLMNYSLELYKTEIKELSSQTYKIRNEIKRIEDEEKNNQFNDIFNKGTFKLKESIRFDYGPSRYDYVKSDEFFWEENKGGKTYTLSYMEHRRSNPHMNENGDILEPVYERVKRMVHKRIKKADLERFIKYNVNKIV